MCPTATGADVFARNAPCVGCSESVKAGGLTWAYRKAAPPDAADTAGKLPILLLHGIGSHSYCYRDLARLLAEAGHVVIAPDWPGHGASDKVC